MKDFDVKLGSILRKHREAKNLSQDEVAKRMSITSMAVSNWELGKRSMYANALSDYCKILGISIQTVFDEMEG